MSPETDLWPAELDALVAASEHHRLALETDRVRVIETLVQPGETVKLHTHENPAVTYFLQWSDFVRRDEHGQVLLDTQAQNVSFNPGQAVWTSPLGPHTLENVGGSVLQVIVVEVKPAGA